tara:strand:+ start:11498 stop:11986 length:489 start_codon:yes stop_codon:yes gene_type:complete
MKKDAVDDILEQWSDERPELDTASLGVVIRVMSLYKAFFGQASAALEPLDLEVFEYDVMSALRRQGSPFALAASELAAETGMSSGAMTNRINRLEDRGIVQRKQDKSDRRGVIVSLTQRGLSIIDDAIRLRLDAADSGLSGIAAGERRQLARLLRKLNLAAA